MLGAGARWIDEQRDTAGQPSRQGGRWTRRKHGEGSQQSASLVQQTDKMAQPMTSRLKQKVSSSAVCFFVVRVASSSVSQRLMAL